MDISLQGLLGLIVWVAIIGGVFYLLWWLIGFIGLPEPFGKVLRVIVAIVAVIFLVQVLLGLAGGGGAPTIKLR